MPIYIFDADVLDRLAAVEGPAWRALQLQQTSSPYGFQAWLAAWRQKAALTETEPDYADEPVRSFVDGGDGALYGAGGYTRYTVSVSGELVLLRWSATDTQLQKAEAAGFSIR